MDNLSATISKFQQVCITPTHVLIASVLSLVLFIISITNYFTVKAMVPVDKTKRSVNDNAAVRTSLIILAVATIGLIAASLNTYKVLA